MKHLFTIIVLIFSLLTVSAQETPTFNLEYYSLEEIEILLTKQFNYTYSSYFVEHYWCKVPSELACQIFPFLRGKSDMSSQPQVEPPSIDKLVYFQSLTDLEKIKKHLEPYILKSSTIHFLRSEQNTAARLSYKNTTLDDYTANQIQKEFRRSASSLLSFYSDGFLIPNFGLAWSNLKNSSSYIDNSSYLNNSSYLASSPYLSELYTYPYNTYSSDEQNFTITKAEAEVLLGGSVSLIRTVHSLFHKKNEPKLLNQSNTSDEFIWARGTTAVGFYSKKRYTIVDEFEQPFNILENPVETRITTKNVAGVDLLEILVMFDLVPLEE